MKKKTLFIILVISTILIIPIAINFLLMLPTPFKLNVLGSKEDWLSFWGTYIGGIIASSVSFVILYLTLLQNKKEAEIERANNKLTQLKKNNFQK